MMKIPLMVMMKRPLILLDGVAMGSSLGPALPNIFLSSFENKWLKDCPHGLKPVLYRRHVDDIFVFVFALLIK